MIFFSIKCRKKIWHYIFFLVTSRPLRRLYPEPSAPSLDEGYFGSPSRGMKHPRSESPFSRNVCVKTKQEMEAISGLLNFTEHPPPLTRNYSTTPKPASPQTVTAAIRPFPTTPAAATRPPRPPPPRIISRRPVAAHGSTASSKEWWWWFYQFTRAGILSAAAAAT